MNYSLIDCHCDTASVALDKNTGFFENDLQVNLSKINFKYTQFFAAFIAPEYKECAEKRAVDIINKIKYEISRNKEKIALCVNYKEYMENQDKVRAFISLEGGECIKNIDFLHRLYDEGVRMATLTWNGANHLAGGAADCGAGLSEFGKLVVKEMNKLGIIIDVSHLNDKSFWEVIDASKKTVIVSHSNSRAICPNVRNLTDEQFLAIKSKGGTVGINLYPLFLSGDKEAGVSNIIKHIEHFLSLGGEDNISMGCDFDGIDFLPEEIGGIEDVYKIFDEMLRLGYCENIVNKLSCTNMERILQENL